MVAGRSPWALWFGAIGGIAAYVLHLLASFWFVPFACRLSTRIPLHTASAVLGLVAAAAIVVAWRNLSAVRAEGGPQAGGAGVTLERARFMAVFGLYLNLLGFLIVVFGEAANLVLDPCI